MSFDRAVGDLLRAAVASPPAPRGVDDVLARTPRDRLRGLDEAAAFHGVVGYVARAVESSPARDRAPDDVRARLAEARVQLVARHAAVVDNLRRIGALLDALQVPWLVVKGPVLAVSVHQGTDLRVYEDLDVVVPADGFGDVLEAFEQAGATVLAGDWQGRVRARAGEVPVRLPSGLLVDLHWHLVNSGAIRDHFRVPMAELFERRTSVDVDGLAVPTLDPADALAHVALHTILSGSHRLVWLKDVERLVARYGQGVLDTAAARMADWGGAVAMVDAVSRTARTVGLPPGIDVPRATDRGARAWLAMAATVERVSPVERQDGSASLLRLVSRAVRSDVPGSARALADKVRRGGAATLGVGSGGAPRAGHDGEPGTARARYLADVAGTSAGAG